MPAHIISKLAFADGGNYVPYLNIIRYILPSWNYKKFNETQLNLTYSNFF